MAQERTCPRCGEVLAADAPSGLCVRCLLAMGVPGEVQTVPLPSGEKLGQRIGPYKLLQKIGEGGMGTVWMAEQIEPIRRMVALKIIKQGIDSDQVLARFEVERQALALMDHPNIAKIFDAGVTDAAGSEISNFKSQIHGGRPYFVMELVKGIPLIKFCDEQRLSIRERLELFVPVCQAIQHAHQKGIIHRDISPSNVLVALYDGGPVPKVIDFGIAKASGLRLTERTLFTEFGALIGKLEYMSPEQAEMNQLDIDTRSDIYSLGVLLYELLTGTTPLKRETLRQVAFDEVLRRIREEEPPRPSTRLSQTSDRLPAISAQRKLQPSQLMSLVSRDLDWIVMKALEKDRVRRYETASALALDVRRYLNDEPVLAGPPTTRYRLRKFLRKHRAAVAVSAGFALLLVVAAVVSTGFAFRAIEARKLAETRLYHADMNLAVQAVAEDNFGFARKLMDVHRDDFVELHGFEWRYLWRQCRGDSVFELRGHSDTVRYLTFCPDGSLLASRSLDSTVKLWDLSNQRERFEVPGTWWLSGFSADGRNLVVAAPINNGAVRLYDVQSGRQKSWLMLEGKPMQLLADGQTVASISSRFAAKFWDLGKRKETTKIAGANSGYGRSHSESYTAFSLDGRRVAVLENPENNESAKRPGQITVSETNAQWTLRPLPGWEETQYLSFSPDGEVLAIAGPRGRLWLWEVSTERTPRELSGSPATVRAIEFSPDGQFLATGSSDHTIRLYDAKTRQFLWQLRGHESGVESLAFSADGRWLASGSRDRSVRLWRMDKSPSTLRAPDLGFLGVWQRIVFSPDGKLLAGRKGTGTLIVWDVATLRPQATLEQPLAPLAFSSAGESLRVAAPEQFEVVDVSSRRARRESVIPPSDLDLSRSALAYCETTGLLACQSEQGSLQLVDRATGQITPIPVAKDSVAKFDFSPRGDWFVTGELQLSNNVVNANGVIRLRDGRTGVALAALIHNTGLICSFAFSPDGLTLASGTSDAGITLWDMARRKVVRTLKGHRQPVNGLAFSPDGKGLASGGSDGTVKLWRVAPDRQIDRELASLNFAGNDPTTSRVNVGWVAFSPDGNTLAALSRDGNILRLWRAASWEEIKSTEAAGVR